MLPNYEQMEGELCLVIVILLCIEPSVGLVVACATPFRYRSFMQLSFNTYRVLSEPRVTGRRVSAQWRLVHDSERARHPVKWDCDGGGRGGECC